MLLLKCEFQNNKYCINMIASITLLLYKNYNYIHEIIIIM